MSRIKTVSIIGGGVTGLTCAYTLARAGHRVTIYEKASQNGGLAGSFHVGDFVFDYGPHEFCTENPLLINLLQEILGDDLLIRHKKAAQYFNGKYIDYPISPLGILRQMSPLLISRVGFEVVIQRLRAVAYNYSDHSFERWVNSRFGPTLYKTYFKPYTEKVWGIDPDQLDARTASNRIAFNSIFDYLLKAFRYFILGRNDFDSIHSPLKDRFYYCRNGIGNLSKHLVEHCKKLDVQFVNDCALQHVEINENRVKSLQFNNGITDTTFDYAISTIPITDLLSCIGEETARLPIRFRSMVFVFLEVSQPQLSPYSWIYFPDKDICFQRATDFVHFDAEMVPRGKTGICLEISCFNNDSIWKDNDENIVAYVREGLAKANLLPADQPCKSHVIRRNFIYPIQVNGYQEMVYSLLEPVRQLGNFVSTGRQGLYKYCNMNECMEMALSVADQINQGADSFEYELGSNWKGAGIEEKP
ncbi:MAG: FAD-dependent oxidoreductase [Candidatus Latescibacterota bacterium]|nr:FAD-dependent oxidoreductase [Candidatus Latescibacterota bacterium]